MEWLRNKITGSSTQDSSNDAKQDECDCTQCDQPCNDHPHYPTTLSARIKGGPLEGTAKEGERHLVLCTGMRDWPAKMEKDESAPLPCKMGKVLKQHGFRILYTASDLESGVFFEGGRDDSKSGLEQCDVIFFPDRVVYQNVNVDNVETLIQSHLVDGKICESIPHAKVPEDLKFVLMCAHKKRDKRCGVTGPMMIEELEKVVQEKGVEDQYKLLWCSHIGGHKYAATCIVHPNGDWYGRLTPCDAQRLIECHFEKGKPLTDCLRGKVFPESTPKLSW
eukprot:TRINITY_DN2929_c0_g1_i1.p2 TRINITY_DN2929_c0_g1~~TRINITY_DN2929_c0_g1_i1.p2  ORF type:complete len:278 (-),score=56.11 TRINITY_DN2929_c0_g1_i1:1126-1959(-)